MLIAIEKSKDCRVVNNEHLCRNIERLRRGLEWCQAHDLHVMLPDIVGAKPTILVETSASCSKLIKDGLAAEIGRDSSGGIHGRVMCVVAEECKIIWIERGH